MRICACVCECWGVSTYVCVCVCFDLFNAMLAVPLAFIGVTLLVIDVAYACPYTGGEEPHDTTSGPIR